jgi:hypothetical protein
MHDIVYDDIFSRTFGYLLGSRIHLTRDRALAALRLIEEILVIDAADPMEQVVTELPLRLDLADTPLPAACPPISRGSIGYGRN